MTNKRGHTDVHATTYKHIVHTYTYLYIHTYVHNLLYRHTTLPYVFYDFVENMSIFRPVHTYKRTYFNNTNSRLCMHTYIHTQMCVIKVCIYESVCVQRRQASMLKTSAATAATATVPFVFVYCCYCFYTYCQFYSFLCRGSYLFVHDFFYCLLRLLGLTPSTAKSSLIYTQAYMYAYVQTYIEPYTSIHICINVVRLEAMCMDVWNQFQLS